MPEATIPTSRNETFWDDCVEELGQPLVFRDEETFAEFEQRARADKGEPTA